MKNQNNMPTKNKASIAEALISRRNLCFDGLDSGYANYPNQIPPKSSPFWRSFARFGAITRIFKFSTKLVWASATRNTHDQTAFFKVADRHTGRIPSLAVTLYVSQAKVRQGMTIYGKGGDVNQDNRVIPGSLAKLIQTGGMKGSDCGEMK